MLQFTFVLSCISWASMFHLFWFSSWWGPGPMTQTQSGYRCNLKLRHASSVVGAWSHSELEGTRMHVNVICTLQSSAVNRNNGKTKCCMRPSLMRHVIVQQMWQTWVSIHPPYLVASWSPYIPFLASNNAEPLGKYAGDNPLNCDNEDFPLEDMNTLLAGMFQPWLHGPGPDQYQLWRLQKNRLLFQMTFMIRLPLGLRGILGHSHMLIFKQTRRLCHLPSWRETLLC